MAKRIHVFSAQRERLSFFHVMHKVVFQFPRCALRSRAQRTAPNESIRDHNVVPRLSRAIALRMVPRRNVEREST